MSANFVSRQAAIADTLAGPGMAQSVSHQRGTMAKARSKTHETFVRNLETIIEQSPQRSATAWAEAHRLSSRNINRMIAGDQSPSLDTLHDIAAAVGTIQAWHLLMPNLDPTNPPVFVMTREESELYERMRAAAALLKPVG